MPKRQYTIKTFFQRSEEKKRPLLELDDNSSDPVKEDLEDIKDKSLIKLNTLNCSSSSNSEEKVTKIKKAKLGESINPDIDANRTGELIQPTQSITDSKDNILALCQDLNGCLDSNIGLSWFKALEREFQKPYFKILNNFLIKVSYIQAFPLCAFMPIKIVFYLLKGSKLHNIVALFLYYRNGKVIQSFHRMIKFGLGHNILM